MITCTALEEVDGKPSCCGSCHEDADEYGFALCGDGENWWVCCAVSMWLEANGIDICKPPDPDNPIAQAFAKAPESTT
jgi:hypothetical protein